MGTNIFMVNVLLIEDNPADADMIQDILSCGDANYTFKHFEYLKEGINYIDKPDDKIDIVLLDLNLPDAKNQDTINKIKPYSKVVPVIILTGFDDGEIALTAIQEGMQDYIVKERIKQDQLIRSIKYSLERFELSYQLNEYAEELVRSNDELENFAYVASHDLREPLRKVINFGSRLKSKYGDRLDDKALEYIDIMQSASLRMRGLLNALLEYSRVGTTEIKTEAVDFKEVIADIETDLQEKIHETHAKISIVGETLTLYAEPVLFKNLLQNLIANAIKFKKNDISPDIVLEIKDLKEDVEIIVKDNGIGFEPELKETIFEQFMKIHGKDQYEGHGMGLATCLKIAKRHKASIVADSVPGMGSEFKIVWPKA